MTWPGATRRQCFEGRDTAQTSWEPGQCVDGGKKTVKGPSKVIFLTKVKRLLLQLSYDFATDAGGQHLGCEVASLLESAY